MGIRSAGTARSSAGGRACRADALRPRLGHPAAICRGRGAAEGPLASWRADARGSLKLGVRAVPARVRVVAH